MVDEQEVEEKLYDLYLIKCMNNGWTPTIRDFVVWKDEQYPEEDLANE